MRRRGKGIFEIVNLESLFHSRCSWRGSSWIFRRGFSENFSFGEKGEGRKKKQGRGEERASVWVSRGSRLPTTFSKHVPSIEQVKPSVIARHCLPISVTNIYRSRYIANPLVSFSISHRAAKNLEDCENCERKLKHFFFRTFPRKSLVSNAFKKKGIHRKRWNERKRSIRAVQTSSNILKQFQNSLFLSSK